VILSFSISVKKTLQAIKSNKWSTFKNDSICSKKWERVKRNAGWRHLWKTFRSPRRILPVMYAPGAVNVHSSPLRRPGKITPNSLPNRAQNHLGTVAERRKPLMIKISESLEPPSSSEAPSSKSAAVASATYRYSELSSRATATLSGQMDNHHYCPGLQL